MKCRRCGNPLKEGDRFCSKCGARVFREPLSMSRKSRQTKNRKNRGNDSSDAFEYVPPEKFSWNTSDFPGEHMPTKDIDFNWNTFDDFHRKSDAFKEARVHHDGDEIAFGAGTEKKESAGEEPVKEDAVSDVPVTEAEPEGPEEADDAPEDTSLEGLPEGESIRTEDKNEEEKEKFTWNEPFQQPIPPVRDSQDEETEDVIPESTVSFEDEEDEEETKVDQFYTFNRKNAEFQQLLDQEYEKYRNSRFTPAEEREEVEEITAPEISDSVFPAAEEESSSEAVSVEENEKEKGEVSGTGQEEEKETSETAERVQAFEPEQAQPAEEKPKEETAGHVRKPQKKSGLRTVLTVILILAVIVAVFSATALIAPDSAVGNGIRSVLGISQSSSRPVPEKTDERTAAEDKTGLIQKEIKSDRKGKLTEVKYNAALKYDSALKYRDKDITKSRVLKKNPVYRKTGSSEVHVDRALTGSVIGYAAEHIGKKNGGAVLEIGEYRQDGKNYYAWVSLNDRQKVFKIKDEKNRMNVVKVYDL